MSWDVIADNPDTGVVKMMTVEDDNVLVRTVQDAEPILRLNAEKRSHGRPYYARDPDLHRLASIPIGVAYAWLTQYGVEAWNPDHLPKVVKLLNDPEWRYLKTADVVL